MAQWINIFQNNSFVNPTRLPLLCRNYRAVALGELGLTAGWLAGWLINEMRANFKLLKFIIDRIFILFAVFNNITVLLEQQECISVGIFSKSVVVVGVKIGEAIVFLIDPYY